MSDSYGKNLTVTVFGESHGAGIGVVVDGLRPGIAVSEAEIARQMARRAPGGHLGTTRREADRVEILSGVFNGYTCGTSVCGLIRNQNAQSSDYEQLALLPRPSHADYPAHVKYRGFEDYRGGGHFSGRLTAPLVFAGALCRMALADRGIAVGSHILQLHSLTERPFAADDLGEERLADLSAEALPLLEPANRPQLEACIEQACAEGDSVGGVVETAVTGLPAGLGDPLFDSMESRLAQILFSVPAVKGLSFGSGFALAGMKGSEANDAYELRDDRIVTATNHNGGILGGITNGMPVVFRTVLKPTPSIAKPQRTVNLTEGREETLRITGRHDPCIIPRAIPVLEACAMIAVYDAWKEAGLE